MTSTKMTKFNSIARLLLATVAALFLTVAAHASAPGITGTGGQPAIFNLDATDAYLNQPDGSSVYSWGYGCSVAPDSTQFQPAAMQTVATCSNMQVPGPTMIVTEGTTVTITLTNNLPTPAGNTSILFPGLTATAAPAATQPPSCTSLTPTTQGLLTTEVAPGCAITYTIANPTPGTHAYYSGTQADLQIEMGLYGAIIVLPAATPTACTTGTVADDLSVTSFWGEFDFRNAGTNGTVPGAAYDNPRTCYNREYLFQWAEMDTNIHRAALAQVTALQNSTACGGTGANPTPNSTICSLHVPTEPYHPAYFVINGRSMPDLMDPNFASEYPHQPYNGNPHIHPGELMLIRTIGQGRLQHPYHEHANHVRILARDGGLVLSATDPNHTDLAGLLMFDTDTTPGEAFDGIFYYTGRGLNWDPYGHTPNSFSQDPLASLPCYPDANGYNTGYDPVTNALTHPEVLNNVNYYEWCQDHNKPVEANPFGDVASGGPATLPAPNIFTNGPWYGGTPYLGPDATVRSSSSLRPVSETGGPYGSSAGCGSTSTASGGVTQTPNSGCTNLQPSNSQANPGNERGWAFMWHSHNEREITTNNVFPGGMLMMLLVDSREFVIDETN
jgi:Multicopper oxidase